MKALNLRFSEGRSCRVWIGEGLIGTKAPIWTRDPVLREAGRAFLIADSALSKSTRALKKTLRSRGWQVTSFKLRAGESSKDLKVLDSFYRKLIENGADRRSVIFALGGGVIGDVAGFIAATYMRGIRWVAVPTTLLAQVDSSLGGKTGVNHALGKNLIGAFHQPQTVICDLSLLRNLPAREVTSGLGEIAKYALLSSPTGFRWFEKNWDALAKLHKPVLRIAVARCLSIKAELVQKDEHETRGLRAKLNLGHTVGHALEAVTGFSRFRHGEAVVHGLRVMLEISSLRGHLDFARKEKLLAFLSRTPVPSIPEKVNAAQIVRLTSRDKKALRGKARFVLLQDVGRTIIDGAVSDAEMKRALQATGLGERKSR